MRLAELMRSVATERLTGGGYNVVDARGPGIIYARMALTDVEMTKKKRGFMSYTPVGAVVKAGSDMIKEALDKVDITRMTLQAELLDGETGEVLGALVVVRATPEGKEPVRIDVEELTAIFREYGSRLRCGLDNAKAAPAEQVNCLDPAERSVKHGGASPN
jgi:hypothetical protein